MNIREIKPQEAPMALLLLADPEEHVIASYLPRSRCFVLEHEGRVAGVYVLLPTRPYTSEIVNIAVAEHLQGNGFGKAMLAHAIQQARAIGSHTIEIGTGNSSIGQLYLYQKCGFRITGVELDFFTRHYQNPIYENGILCRDMLRLQQHIAP
ncbi:GNAT family N-acetyltransferase [Paenibacillus sp. y28]|uniref:GNAT family N-acetyltransferase n=1 Tax=Paenibacillus sp. y28 TaxID=3129110 RepID=UPI003017C209